MIKAYVPQAYDTFVLRQTATRADKSPGTARPGLAVPPPYDDLRFDSEHFPNICGRHCALTQDDRAPRKVNNGRRLCFGQFPAIYNEINLYCMTKLIEYRWGGAQGCLSRPIRARRRYRPAKILTHRNAKSVFRHANAERLNTFCNTGIYSPPFFEYNRNLAAKFLYQESRVSRHVRIFRRHVEIGNDGMDRLSVIPSLYLDDTCHRII